MIRDESKYWQPLNLRYFEYILRACQYNDATMECMTHEDNNIAITVKDYGTHPSNGIKDKEYHKKRCYDLKEYYEELKIEFPYWNFSFEKEIDESFKTISITLPC